MDTRREKDGGVLEGCRKGHEWGTRKKEWMRCVCACGEEDEGKGDVLEYVTVKITAKERENAWGFFFFRANSPEKSDLEVVNCTLKSSLCWWFTKKMSGCLMALQVPCNPDTIGFLPHWESLKYPQRHVCNHWENRGKMTVCHIDVRPQGFCVATFHGSVSQVQLLLLYWVASLIVFVYSTFTSPAVCQILGQKSIGVILWLTYFLHCPNSQMSQPTVSFIKCFKNVLCVEMAGNCWWWQVSYLFTLYLLSDFLFSEYSDISTDCQAVVLPSCCAWSLLQGLMFSLCRKQSIVTRAGGGRPVETNGLVPDK